MYTKAPEVDYVEAVVGTLRDPPPHQRDVTLLYSILYVQRDGHVSSGALVPLCANR